MTFTQVLSPEYTIYAAKNGQEAIELANKYLPDLILLDVLMPEMDGYEVISVLKNTEETRAIPVIFITGLASADAEEKGLRMGAVDYITKPCVPGIVRLRVLNQIQMLNRIKTMGSKQPEPKHVEKLPVNFGGGDGGSLESAYKISSRGQLEKLAKDVNSGTSYRGSYFIIDSDIDLDGMRWTPIGYCVGPLEKRGFAGILDGNGHTVSNFKIEKQDDKSAGLFGYIEYAVVQNLYVKDFWVNGGTVIGGVAGYSETSTIASCYAEGRIESEPVNAGGIVGIASNSRVENSASSIMMKVSQGSTAGGLCGLAYNGSRFYNCESQGRVRAKNMASVGGFIGSIKDCALGNCHARLSVTSMNCGNIGGFCGSGRNCTFDWCTASGSVRTASDDISSVTGGFIGFTNSVVTRCIASGDVIMSGDQGASGGFAGEVSRASIFLCYSSGSVASEGHVGGFAGMAHCSEGSTSIENCYTLSQIISEDKITQAGGFIGALTLGEEDNVTITSCYSFGKLSPKVNGFTGRQPAGIVTNCVWLRDEGGINEYVTDDRDIPALSTRQFGDENVFAEMGWSITDDDSVWRYYDEIKPRRPHLNGLPVVNPE